MSLEPVRPLGGGSIATELAEGGVGAALGRLSLDLSGGGGVIRPNTLLDEYERLAIEAQLSRAVLRRSYSEPSPSRLVVLPDEARPAARRAESEKMGAGRAPREPRARRFWLLEALKRVLCWLSSGWGGRAFGRKEEETMPCPPPAAAATRVQLLDYLR